MGFNITPPLFTFCFLLCKLFISLLNGLFLADYGKRKILPFFLEKSGYLCKELEEYVKI